MKYAGGRPLIEALDEPAMVIDRTVVSMANEAARTLFGIAVEGKDVRLSIRHPHALDHILSGRPGDVELAGIGEFGRPWTLSVRELGDGAILVRLVDRTTAAAADKTRVDFVANASHELRTPLSTILGYAEPLADDAVMSDAERARLGSIIRTDARRMLRIIEDLMSLSRIEAGRFVSPDEKVAIPEVLEISLASARRMIGTQPCSIDVDVEQSLPRVVGDSAQLCQLLDNLLSNAVRYGCRDGKAAVRVSIRRNAGFVVISVEDQGAGIGREHIPHLTKRFYRPDSARNRDSGGTGLGLSIVKHIVERHRGHLEIQSELGVGTTVQVRLPIHS
jgi:two-component system phosphate regulon sensor histidine kinase PhoR